jgi:hypothetical protein
VHDLRLVERGAEHGCVGDFAAHATANATVVDVGDWIIAQRVWVWLDRERGAAR